MVTGRAHVGSAEWRDLLGGQEAVSGTMLDEVTVTIKDIGPNGRRYDQSDVNRHRRYQVAIPAGLDVRPRKPAGVENKTAWFVGSGLAALAGAAFLIRDGQMPGNRQRTTPWIAGIRPRSIWAASAWRCPSVNNGVGPGALRSHSPSGPSALAEPPSPAQSAA